MALRSRVKKQHNYRAWFIALVCLAIVIPGAYILINRLEGRPPEVAIDLPSDRIGITRDMHVRISDPKSGIRSVRLTLHKDGKEHILLEKTYSGEAVIQGGDLHEETLAVEIEPQMLGVSDGKAVLRLTAHDYSWRRWWHGNSGSVEKEVIIDTQPPRIEVLTRTHNVNQGGSGLVVYRLSEPCSQSGIMVGDNFFPGYDGYFKDPSIFLAFFALNHTQGSGTPLFVKAVDEAQNNARAGFPHYIKNRTFRKDTINLPDSFLNWKVPEFEKDLAPEAGASLVDKFLQVNRRIRQENNKEVRAIAAQSEPTLFWEGTFSRLPNSARMASFADQRDYRYKGKSIDVQYHMGIDLASIAHCPIPSANRGKVVYAGILGIYGNTVILDHGFGLFSVYSHLSAIDVQPGEMVEKDGILGRSGNTGLAGGDHLHFGMMVHNTWVNPIEWWDGQWIANNITAKIDMVASTYSQEQQ